MRYKPCNKRLCNVFRAHNTIQENGQLYAHAICAEPTTRPQGYAQHSHGDSQRSHTAPTRAHVYTPPKTGTTEQCADGPVAVHKCTQNYSQTTTTVRRTRLERWPVHERAENSAATGGPSGRKESVPLEERGATDSSACTVALTAKEDTPAGEDQRTSSVTSLVTSLVTSRVTSFVMMGGAPIARAGRSRGPGGSRGRRADGPIGRERAPLIAGQVQLSDQGTVETVGTGPPEQNGGALGAAGGVRKAQTGHAPAASDARPAVPPATEVTKVAVVVPAAADDRERLSAGAR